MIDKIDKIEIIKEKISHLEGFLSSSINFSQEHLSRALVNLTDLLKNLVGILDGVEAFFTRCRTNIQLPSMCGGSKYL